MVFQAHPHTTTTDASWQHQSLPEDLRKEKSVKIGENKYSVTLSRLSRPQAISMKVDGMLYCDCHDLTVRPREYQVHLYPCADRGRHIDFQVKLGRMKHWQQSLEIFDSLMESPTNNSQEEILRILESGCIPRADLAVIDTGNPSLQKLLEALEFRSTCFSPGSYIVPWDNLVAVAREDRIVSQWLKQKGMFG